MQRKSPHFIRVCPGVVPALSAQEITGQCMDNVGQRADNPWTNQEDKSRTKSVACTSMSLS